MDDYFYAINPDGTEKWKFLTQGYGIPASPAIAEDGTIYLMANDGNFYAFNPDGTEKWRLFMGEWTETTSSPAIGADGTIYVGTPWGDSTPTFYAINPDGTIKWSLPPTGGGISSSPAIGADGTIYFGSWDYKLYAIGGSE